MDPTQNKDSFDSFGSGGNNPGASVGGQANSAAQAGATTLTGGQAVRPTTSARVAQQLGNRPVARPSGISAGVMTGNQGGVAYNMSQMNANPMMNSGFNQTGFGPMAVASGDGGDIVVGGTPKKSKKGLVIGAMILVLLITTGVLVWVFADRLPISSGNGARESHNKFANYAVSGEIKNTPIDEEYDPAREYYFEKQQISEEGNTEYYVQVDTLWNEFAEKFNEISNNNLNGYSGEMVRSVFDDQNQLVKFIDLINHDTLPTMIEIVDLYNQNGKENTLKLMEKRFNFLDSDSENIYISNFSVSYEEWAELQINRLYLYDSVECIVDGLPDSGCIETKDDSIKAELNVIQNNLEIAQKNIVEQTSVSDDFLVNVFLLNDILNGTDTINKMTVEGENSDG